MAEVTLSHQKPLGAVLKQESSRAEPELRLSASAVVSLWHELTRGARERQVVLDTMRARDDAFLRRVRWETNSYLRIRAAFEALVLARTPGLHIGTEPDAVDCDDEIGLALFAGYVSTQLERLSAVAKGPRGSDSEEAQGRLPVFHAMRERFHQALGLDAAQVRARAGTLSFDGDPRTAPRALFVHGRPIRSEEEAYLSPDEEQARVAAVLADLS